VLTPEQQIKQIEREIEKIEQRRREVMNESQGYMKNAQAMVQFASKELERLAREPASPTRDIQVQKNELRRQAALCTLEMMMLLAQTERAGGGFSAISGKVELISLKTQYLTTEYYVAHYQRTAGIIEQALAQKVTEPAEASGQGSASLGSAQLAETRPSLPSIPGLPGRSVPGKPLPGVPRPAAPAAPVVGVGRPPAVGARPVPGAPVGKSPSFTRPGMSPAKVSAPEPDTGLLQQVAESARDKGMRTKLTVLLNHFRELEEMLKSLRGFETGTLSMDMAAAAPFIRQVAGKVYYLNRAVSDLGPLSGPLSFDQAPADPAVKAYIAQAISEPDQASPADGVLGSRFKSLFRN
jgi:hypothetical protein